MFKKRFLLALALAGMTGLSFGNLNTISGLFSTQATTATVACTGGGSESFSNLGSSSSSYSTRVWTGDNGVEWTATDARTDQDLNGDAIAVRSGSLKNTSIVSDGVGTINFDYARVFSGNSTLQLFVNGVQYGADITVSSTSATTFTQVVNVSGDVVIELINSGGKRTIIDDLSWDCYSAPTVPCAAPVAATSATSSNVTATSADISVVGATADTYLVVSSASATLSAGPVDATEYAVNDNIGGGQVVYVGTDANFTLSNLTEDTDYNLFVYPNNNVDCTGGPLYTATSTDLTVSTPVAPCIGANETFSNLGSSASSYTTRSWTGDNGVNWTATDARTDQDLNGDAIAIRTGSLSNDAVITGGVGTLSFNYARVFSNNSILKVFVNGVQYGGDIDVTDTAATVFSTVVDVDGDVTVSIENSGYRTIIDDLTWNCYEVPNRPEIQLLDSNLAVQECGNFNLDFNNVETGVDADRTFTVKNAGLLDLTVSALTLSDATNYTIVSPAVPFTLTADSTQDVTVRFNSATAAAYPATLTVVSDDAEDACAAPSIDSAALNFANITASSIDVTVDGVTADGYIAVLGDAGVAPVAGTTYVVGDTLGTDTIIYVGTDATFSIADLDESTAYPIFIYAYNDTDCFGAPVYSEGTDDEFTTEVAPCVGANETFSNLGSSASNYTTRSWTGDNGINWTATDARTDQDLNGDAIAIRTGSLSNDAVITGGIGTLSFNYARVFTGNSTLKVFVNGVQYGGDIDVTDTAATAFSTVVDVAGSVTVSIENSGKRTIIDDLTWGCYEVPNRPEIQLLDSNAARQECGNFNLDFNNVETGVDADRTFTVKNGGLLDLTVSALTLSDATNYTIVSPAVPFTLTANSTQDVTVRFNSATAAAYPATLTVVSDDADEANCVVDLNANAQDACTAPSIDSAALNFANITASSIDVTVDGVTADGYIAVLGDAGVAPVAGTTYVVGDTLGADTIIYVGTDATFSIADLDGATAYPIFVYAYNDTNCFNGPAYSEGTDDEFTTDVAPCVGATETFSNLGSSSSSYTTRTWTGDNGINWTATDARTDRDLNGDAICVRSGSLSNDAVISGGIGTLSFNYARVFSRNSILKVYVNGVQYGGDIDVTDTAPTLFSEVINVTGDITVELVNSGKRTVIDDLTWDCYAGSSARMAMTTVEENNVTSTLSSKEVVLYPNPNNGQFQVELTSTDATAQVEVFDTLGKRVFSKNISGTETINLENANKGIYMAVITSGNNVTTKKVVIK